MGFDVDIEDIFKSAVKYAEDPNAYVVVLCTHRLAEQFMSPAVFGKDGTYYRQQFRWISENGGQLRAVCISHDHDVYRMAGMQVTHALIHGSVDSSYVPAYVRSLLRGGTNYKGKLVFYSPWIGFVEY